MNDQEEQVLGAQFRNATIEVNRLQAELNIQTALRMHVAWRMHEEGLPYRRIAELVGLSTARVYQMVGTYEDRLGKEVEGMPKRA